MYFEAYTPFAVVTFAQAGSPRFWSYVIVMFATSSGSRSERPTPPLQVDGVEGAGLDAGPALGAAFERGLAPLGRDARAFGPPLV
jgi:hypothetical protein